MQKYGIMLFIVVVFGACTPHRNFEEYDHYKQPDYSKEDAWICLPTRHNASDTVPHNSAEKDMQSTAKVDVFYIYPTLDLSGRNWNADIKDSRLNKTIEKTAIVNQASVFNGCCKVYSPRYRQATLAAFYDKTGKGSGSKALQLAYTDIRSAFQYYIKNYNKGRPFIIAGHSQGTLMAYKLLQEFVDTTALRKQLVAAYLIGYHIENRFFKNLKPSDSATQTGCYVVWNTVATGSEYTKLSSFFSGVCVNPLTWNQDTAFVDARKNIGTLNHYFNIDSNEVGAGIRNGVLHISKPVHKGFKQFGTGYHIYDYNFFYEYSKECSAACNGLFEITLKIIPFSYLSDLILNALYNEGICFPRTRLPIQRNGQGLV